MVAIYNRNGRKTSRALGERNKTKTRIDPSLTDGPLETDGREKINSGRGTVATKQPGHKNTKRTLTRAREPHTPPAHFAAQHNKATCRGQQETQKTASYPPPPTYTLIFLPLFFAYHCLDPRQAFLDNITKSGSTNAKQNMGLRFGSPIIPMASHFRRVLLRYLLESLGTICSPHFAQFQPIKPMLDHFEPSLQAVASEGCGPPTACLTVAHQYAVWNDLVGSHRNFNSQPGPDLTTFLRMTFVLEVRTAVSLFDGNQSWSADPYLPLCILAPMCRLYSLFGE